MWADGPAAGSWGRERPTSPQLLRGGAPQAVLGVLSWPGRWRGAEGPRSTSPTGLLNFTVPEGPRGAIKYLDRSWFTVKASMPGVELHADEITSPGWVFWHLLVWGLGIREPYEVALRGGLIVELIQPNQRFRNQTDKRTTRVTIYWIFTMCQVLC